MNLVTNRKVERTFSLFHLYPIFQNNITYNDDRLVIYYEPNVSMNEQYNIYEKDFFLIEKKIDELIHSNAVSLEIRITNDKNKYSIHYGKFLIKNENWILKDTVKTFYVD